MRLQAIKPLTYATRRLQPGDIFDAPNKHARIWLATKKAKLARDPAPIPPPPAGLVETVTDPAPRPRRRRAAVEETPPEPVAEVQPEVSVDEQQPQVQDQP